MPPAPRLRKRCACFGRDAAFVPSGKRAAGDPGGGLFCAVAGGCFFPLRTRLGAARAGERSFFQGTGFSAAFPGAGARSGFFPAPGGKRADFRQSKFFSRPLTRRLIRHTPESSKENNGQLFIPGDEKTCAEG